MYIYRQRERFSTSCLYFSSTKPSKTQLNNENVKNINLKTS